MVWLCSDPSEVGKSLCDLCPHNAAWWDSGGCAVAVTSVTELSGADSEQISPSSGGVSVSVTHTVVTVP